MRLSQSFIIYLLYVGLALSLDAEGLEASLKTAAAVSDEFSSNLYAPPLLFSLDQYETCICIKLRASIIRRLSAAPPIVKPKTQLTPCRSKLTHLSKIPPPQWDGIVLVAPTSTLSGGLVLGNISVQTDTSF